MQRYRYLDSIRGIAALCVVYLHSVSYILQHNLYVGPSEYIFMYMTSYFVDLGKMAVTIFFAISGFIVPFSLLKKTEFPIKAFIISRIFRLYPVYWVSIFLSLVVFYYLAKKELDAKTIFLNIVMLQQFFGFENINTVYWTLQIELIFYFLCVIIFYNGKLNSENTIKYASLSMLFGAFFLSIARYYTQSKLPVALPLALSIMFWGMLWRQSNLTHDENAKRSTKLLLAFYALFIPIRAWLSYNTDHGFDETWYRYTLTYYLALIIFVLMTTRFKLENTFGDFTGRISYSAYLHGLIVQAVVFDMFIYAYGSVENIPKLGIFFVFIIIGSTILFSWLVCYSIEEPCIRLGRRLVRLVENPGIFASRQRMSAAKERDGA